MTHYVDVSHTLLCTIRQLETELFTDDKCMYKKACSQEFCERDMLLAEKVSQFEFAPCNSGSTIVHLAQCLRNWSEFEGISSGTLLRKRFIARLCISVPA